MNPHPMEVEIWEGDWGLPSIDIDCLQILAYGKFSGAPIKTKVVNSPFRRTLPTFRHGAVTCTTLEEFSTHLMNKNLNADLSLTNKQKSEVQAYRQLLKDKLYPGLQYVWWADSRNCLHLTRPWYGKTLRFPFNFYYPGAFERKAKNLICTLYNCYEDELQQVETQVYSDAEKCLTLLSNRLGESNYFHGAQPTSLDALIYSYLAPLLKAPFPNATLQNHLKACSNLVKFVDRINSKYFPNISQDYNKKVRDEGKKKEEEGDFPNKRRNQFFAGFIAFIAMAGYGLSTGLLQVTFESEENMVDYMNDSSTADDE